MMLLRCTGKVFRKVGGKPRAIEVSAAEPTFGEWYVNTVDFINRGDLLACMHVESLYILFVPVGPKATAEQLMTGLQSRLLTRLIELETPPHAAQSVLATYQDSAVLSKASDRRIAGHMNSALQDLGSILDIPHLHLREGNKLMGPRIEHRLNSTPRGLAGKNVIWPLTAFWQCVRNLSPQLPARATIGLMPIHDRSALRRLGDVLYGSLPDHLAGKLYAGFQDVDVLYSADELRTIADAMDKRPALRDGLPPEQYIARQVRVRLERLMGDPTAV
jgi:hypothetical protein